LPSDGLVVVREGDQVLNSVDRHRREVLMDFLDGRAKIEIANDPIRFDSSPFYSGTAAAPTWDGFHFGAFQPPHEFLVLDHLNGPLYCRLSKSPDDWVDFMAAKHEITARRDAMQEFADRIVEHLEQGV
jgi:hypothetical protein